ncbi:endonuclease [Polymorphobacter sp. PAMC 29334]|uniref:endonuclease n=1 Tax=Polymorphobacter sp. PAMC 29334 TaxID=2862331 RepID=UPI001C7789C6|nr:endonuclease [Polymorphobacter sp. PAMC 29334]QYE35233.1 endonuclease [Polymorphobacter sp. PAMC 29334]
MTEAAPLPTPPNAYQALIERIFLDRYTPGATVVEFERHDIPTAAEAMGRDRPKNLGDVIYALRYRTSMPASVLATQPEGMEWIIEGSGRARYRFCLVPLNRIVPRNDMASIAIPDSTPEIIRAYALDDEQALLAIVRYNRLIDIFLGLTTYSLQNHLRTSVKGIGQIEIDELYLGLDRHGCHYVIPVQAKGGTDQISVVQTKQDIAWCRQRFEGVRPRAISAQFMRDDKIAMFELSIQDEQIVVVDEKHYLLTAAAQLDRSATTAYR